MNVCFLAIASCISKAKVFTKVGSKTDHLDYSSFGFCHGIELGPVILKLICTFFQEMTPTRDTSSKAFQILWSITLITEMCAHTVRTHHNMTNHTLNTMIDQFSRATLLADEAKFLPRRMS